MNKQIRRTLVAATASLALAVPLLSAPSAVAQGSAAAKKADKFVNHGMMGDASGARLIVNNVEVLTLNNGSSPLACTRRLGREVTSNSLLSTPEGSPLKLSAATNVTKTYREGKRVGVRATSTLGDIQVGDATGELTGGIPTPEIRIEGMTSVADAFRTPAGYDHEESISDLKLTIDLLPGQDADEPLQELLDAIDTGVLQPVLDVLQETILTGPIEIPGLGSIGLGRERFKVGAHGAESHASALAIVVNATDEKHKLLLGDTHARIGGPARNGVFRSTSMPMRVDVAGGVVRLGHVKPRPLSCEGSRGQEKVKKLGRASVVLPEGLLAEVRGIQYRGMGDQGKRGSAKGYQVSKIGSFSIPLLDLSIEGISSRTAVNRKSVDGKVRKTAKASIGKIMYQGEEVAVPKPGQAKVIDGLGIIESRVVNNGNRSGMRMTALRITLSEFGPTVFDLGISAMRISRR